MLHSARLKLTTYYLLIIMMISFLFSAFIYNRLTQEFDRILQIEKNRLERQATLETIGNPFAPKKIVYINPDVIEETKDRILWTLVAVNMGILTISAAAGYFLAGRTLKPIEEMMDHQNQFITDASHELRTPLTALKTEIEVSLRDPKLKLSDAKKLLNSNLEEVNSLQHLSDSMMKLAQNPFLKKSVLFEPLSVGEEVKNAIKKTSPLAKNKQIDILFNGKDYLVSGEKGTISELCTILLDNAIKYSDDKTKVMVTAKSTDGQVEIEVTDQGIGISESDLPHLFDRFYRSDKSRSKTNIDGFGLGLSIAKKIVQTLNGKIEVSSIENQGTTFKVTLPRLKKV